MADVPRPVVFGLAAVTSTAPTYLTVYADPSVTPRPAASNLNAAANSVVPNLVIARMPADRLIGVYNNAGRAAIVVDLNGYYAP